MHKIWIVLAAGSSLASAPAFAQDAPAPTFTGPYVQTTIGYDKSRSGSTVDIDNTRDRKQSIDGLMYGGGVGYDFAAGERVRVGVEGEVTDSTAKWKQKNAVPNTFALGSVSAGRDLYAGARVGYVTSPNMMVYAKGGYTNARYNVLGTDGTNSSREHLDADGWRVGGGVEMAVNPNTFARLEYRYSNYKEGEIDFPGATPDSNRFNIDTDRHQVTASVGMRF